MPDIGERVLKIRLMRMWTQARLAKEAGISPTTVSTIETGKIERPHFGTLGKLARALDVAPEELLDSQEPDGGWPETTRPPGASSYAHRISTSGWALLALLETR